MSCCGGSCGCGSSCQCTKGCNGCGRNADLSYLESSGASATTLVAGVAPQKSYMVEGAEMGEGGAESGGCKCGSDCKCDPCTCK